MRIIKKISIFKIIFLDYFNLINYIQPIMKAQKIRHRDRKKAKATIPFTRENYIIFFIGILVIILGYIFLAQGPADSFWSLTLAPILLVLSYCIIIPISILYRKRTHKNENSVEVSTSN